MTIDDMVAHRSPAADPAKSAAIEVARLTKLYKTTRAVDRCVVSHHRWQHHGLLGGNGAGKNQDDLAMIMGVLPTSGTSRYWAVRCPSKATTCGAG